MIILVVSGIGYFSGNSYALPRKNNIPDGDDTLILCQPSARIDIPIPIKQNGLPLIGARIYLDATNSKIVVAEHDPNDFISMGCTTTYHPIPDGSFNWEFLTRPAGSNATLTGTNTLAVSFVPDVVGIYRVILTIGCPGGCVVPLLNGETVLAPSHTGSATIVAVDHIERPPETEPVLPSMNFTQSTPIRSGLVEGGVLDPQWVTTKEWTGPNDYELMEGWVRSSRISRKDSPLNHDSQDFNLDVQPDPPYARLMNPNEREMEVEWERDHYPEFFRATRGDRVSTVGYWIYDCGHQFKTEIHPPVMSAVHRARPIRIPESLRLGSNIYVPGIVTDIWINNEAGEITGNCSATGLHNPPPFRGLISGGCLPQSAGFDKNPINRVYEFNIYLPRNPHVVATEAGMQVPPIALYYENTDLQGTFEDPEITVHTQGGVTFLKVKLDLSNYTGNTYSRRIVSGWAYPSPENWGIKSWRVRINSMEVQDDGDGISSGDGDWRFWVNINNGDQEWTKLFDCDGCVNGTEVFGGTPWATGFQSNSNSLGPDILLFPKQAIWLHASGFEDDWVWSDFTGQVTQLHPQEVATYHVNSQCRDDYPSGCCQYTLNYQIEEGTPIGNATLSAEGRALYEAYTLRPNDTRNRPERPDLTELVNSLPQPFERDWNHINDLLLFTGQERVHLNETEFFKIKMTEPHAFSDIGKEALFSVLSISRDRNENEKIQTFVNELQEEVKLALLTRSREEVELGLEVMESSLPEFIWEDIEPIIETAPTITPTVTPSPEPSNTPLPEPTATSLPLPTNTPTSDIPRRVVEIFDHIGDTSGDLTGKTDFDDIDERNLTIHCNAPTTNASNWHVYVRKGLGGFRYLGQTTRGDLTTLNWVSGQSNIAPEFRNGPDVNAVYTFRVIRLDGKLSPDDFYMAEAPVGFNLTGGNSMILANPDPPDLNVGEVAIYDDILGGKNLSLLEGTGTDVDQSDWRALQIAWNFGVDPASVNDYHVYVSIDNGDFVYLGQTGNGLINYFWWSSITEYKMNPIYAAGPESGHTYKFRIYLLPLEGRNQILNSGSIQYDVQ